MARRRADRATNRQAADESQSAIRAWSLPGPKREGNCLRAADGAAAGAPAQRQRSRSRPLPRFVFVPVSLADQVFGVIRCRIARNLVTARSLEEAQRMQIARQRRLGHLVAALHQQTAQLVL